ncbi:hypothetical protein Tsubulata_037710 [Turnera subulata]|uniref:RING-type domain-containing protein n=1 Tax=Turnera subulata TaxID=218843 RepID=A0A9Q0J803_9ROSI|nr:hypothetical protein Tsubulata_037710 [Turnera subulata]
MPLFRSYSLPAIFPDDQDNDDFMFHFDCSPIARHHQSVHLSDEYGADYMSLVDFSQELELGDPLYDANGFYVGAPMPRSAMENLPLVEARSDQECTICTDDIMKGEMVIGLPCSHPFHTHSCTSYGLGVVLRDDKGRVLAAQSCLLHSSYNIRYREALSVLWGCSSHFGEADT